MEIKKYLEYFFDITFFSLFYNYREIRFLRKNTN